MKLVCYSDAHWHFREVKVPPGDVLVYAGDWCSGDDMMNTIHFASHLKTLPHKHKIVIAGNHDRIAESNPELVANLFAEAGVTYLQDKELVIGGVKFYGTPWTPQFCNWAFMKEDEELVQVWKKIPSDTDVLITHGPAFGILDCIPEVGSVGSKSLEAAIVNKKPKIHVCGHIHCGYGRQESDDTYYYNVSVCNEEYDVVNNPTVISL